jgi:hypothetical protein
MRPPACSAPGSTSIRATQDLQIISGLPPLVREGDAFRAQITLRNTTKAAMKVEVAPRATLLELKPQNVEIPPARRAKWPGRDRARATGASRAPRPCCGRSRRKDSVSGARDALKAQPALIPAVPLTVQQATLVQMDGKFACRGAARRRLARTAGAASRCRCSPSWPRACPACATGGRATPLPAWSKRPARPWACATASCGKPWWRNCPTYLDADGLASYFPPREGDGARGSDILTAYLLAATHEAASLNPAFALPDEVRAPMERGLIAFVEGRIQRNFWSPRKDLDVRKLAAIEALSRYGKAQGRMLSSITIAPNQWPTQRGDRLGECPQARGRRAPARPALARGHADPARAPVVPGHQAHLQHRADDYWWWLMQNGDVNTARLMLAVMDDPAWKDDMGRLANGFIAASRRGAWHTTTANLWGGLALEKFSAKFEATPWRAPPRPRCRGNAPAWTGARSSAIKASDASGAPHQTTWFGAPASPGNLKNNSMFLPGARPAARSPQVTHQGTGKPWLTLQSLAAVELKAPFAPATHHQDRHARRAGQQVAAGRPVHARRRAARDAGGQRQRRHDLGGHHRPGARRRHHPGQRPGPRLADRHAGRKAKRSGWAGPRSKSAASSPSAATTSTCPRAW